MQNKRFQQHPLLTLPQFLAVVVIIAGLVFALDLNRRAQEGRLVGVGEEDLQAELSLEQTRQIELQVTATYVYSESYIDAYARNEAGYVQDGEKRVIPLVIEAEPTPTPPPIATLDPAFNARPWQAWWRLLTDAPQPTR